MYVAFEQLLTNILEELQYTSFNLKSDIQCQGSENVMAKKFVSSFFFSIFFFLDACKQKRFYTSGHDSKEKDKYRDEVTNCSQIEDQKCYWKKKKSFMLIQPNDEDDLKATFRSYLLEETI
ncbi:hypothetical protein RFI_04142 [Reticulomyxa filosa]|uniref:Uncharacterized protein n=1 Tax=Reticulomyxa filosa TaxID=46433 RepID=X6P354_RETFI|nr:hypothetical protein RFI_04142 [Reticulomyxa filosa]|eukprot:ETO32965.1 hypothetical protein RFI_04142 [Reticulomyxa filosa]